MESDPVKLTGNDGNNNNNKSTKQNNEKSNSITAFDNLEKLISKHFENNFFLSSDTKRLDDYILHENYIKNYNDESRLHVNYSVCSIFTLFNFLEEFQELKLKKIYNNINSNHFNQIHDFDKENNGILTNINNNSNDSNRNFIHNLYKGKKYDIVISFINSHLNNMIDEINNSSVINPEAEQKVCFSLFFIKKIIKDFTFYFNSEELELIFIKLKHLKE